MLVLGISPGHDGAVTVVKDREVLFHLESEKDSFLRHAKVTPMTLLHIMERIGEAPDVVAFGGQVKEPHWFRGKNPIIGAGYKGSQVVSRREGTLFGKTTTFFSSSHIRSHIIGAAGMAPRDDAERRAVLVWEGYDGSFYLLDDQWSVVDEIEVLPGVGSSYAFLYALADPSYPDNSGTGDLAVSGKLMALAAYGNPADADGGVVETIDRLLGPLPARLKGNYKDSALYNIGVEAEATKIAAALLQDRIFEMFARVAEERLPRDIPLYISGGCGLNCDWNTMWRELGHFSSVFVPPCPNDSGSALGTALDALLAVTGDPRVDWDVYCGLPFENDSDPDASRWESRPMRSAELGDALASGRVVAWVQGCWEMGPRALGNRSLLADPSDRSMLDRLNKIKNREGYRPIAPVCRIEDAGKVFDRDFHDPHMLYFRRVTSPDLEAITHVDGSARAQTVTKEGNKPLHDLLSSYAERRGVGVLCNTSLNYPTMGFINRLSDLAHYCETRGIDDMVVGDTWYQRAEGHVTWDGIPVRSRIVRRLIEQHAPEGATVLVISEGVDEMLTAAGRRGWHFPQNEDGSYRGSHPTDSNEAIAWLEQLRERGATHLAIPATQLWWLDFYADLRQHLEDQYSLVLRNDDCVLFVFQKGVGMREIPSDERGAQLYPADHTG